MSTFGEKGIWEMKYLLEEGKGGKTFSLNFWHIFIFFLIKQFFGIKISFGRRTVYGRNYKNSKTSRTYNRENKNKNAGICILYFSQQPAKWFHILAQYWPARKNVCHKKLRLNLLGPIRNWAHSLHTSFVCLNFLCHTPHAVALDKVLSLSPK